MLQQTTATYSEGVLKPAAPLNLEEGAQVKLTVESDRPRSLEERRAALRQTAGAWKDTIDCDKLIEDIYASRAVVSTRVPKF